MAQKNNHPTTEEEWEMEIRRDERRINRYFRKLPACIDLPDEETFLYNDIADIPELVPQCVSPEDADFRRFTDCNQECDCKDEDICQHNEECIILVNTLAVKWSVVCIEKIPASLRLEGIGISCGLAKLLARIEEFNGIDSATDTALKRSIGKRVIMDIDFLAIKLSCFTEHQELQSDTGYFTGKLDRLRAVFNSKLNRLEKKSRS